MQLQNKARCLIAAVGIAAGTLAGTASAQTAFTYQGVLEQNGSPVSGSETIRFRLFDAQTGGSQFGETTQVVDVAEGVFSAPINFGTLSTIDPASSWLEIAIETGPGVFETLGRQQITAAPFAVNTRGLNVDGSGRLSIGTTAHSDILHIAGDNARILTESTSGFYSGIRSRVAGKEFFTGVDTFPGAANGGAGWHVFDNTGAGRLLALLPNGNFGVGISIPQSRLHVNGGGLFDGNVGIGTSSPNARLDVESDDIDVAYFRSNDAANGRTSLRIYDPNDTSGLIVHKWEGRGGLRMTEEGDAIVFDTKATGEELASEKVRIAANGNVGIGNTSPAARLDVATSGSFLGIQARGTSASFSLDNTNDANTRWTIAAGPSATLEVRDTINGVNVLRVTRAPTHEIQLLSRTSQEPRAVMAESITRADNGRIYTIDENATIRNLMDTQSDGTAFMATDVYLTFSDERLKENIETISDPIAKVQALRGVTYDRKDGSSYNDVGFIAQEVEVVLPQLVHVAANDMKSVSYDRMTALLVEAVKAQQAEIDSLKAQRTHVNASIAWPMLIGAGLFGGLAVARRRNATT